MKTHVIASICFALLVTPAVLHGAKTNHHFGWGPYRGMNTDPVLTEKDIHDFAAMGGNLLRFSFANQPFLKLKPPYQFNEDAFASLDHMLALCEKHGIRAVIDPHRFPGTEHRWTMLGSDPFWKDCSWHDRAIALWEEIARRYKDRGDVSKQK